MPNYELAAERAAKRAGINPRIFKAMIRAESNFNPKAGSPAGARGIAQFMPATARGYNVNLDDGKVSDDLAGAAKYIKDNLKKTGGNYHEALSIYNSGQPDKYKPGGYAETINYVKKIMDGRKTETLEDGNDTEVPAPTRRTTTKTTVTSPGVDNRAGRAAAVQQFLSSKNADPVSFAQTIAGLQDVAAKTTTRTSQVPQSSSRPAQTPATSTGRVGGGPLKELFWQGQDGINAKNGKLVPQGFVSGHTNHVHVASGPETTRRIGKLAQQMGLHVGENKNFTGTTPTSGHAPNSNHYSDRAIDVSGDPAKMRAFAHRVARMYGVGGKS